MGPRRWQALTGAVGLGLLFVVLLLPGPPPKAEESTSELTKTLVDHRAAFVRGTVLAGLAVMLLLWFVAVLADAVRRSDDVNGAHAGAVLLGGGVAVLATFVGMLLF